VITTSFRRIIYLDKTIAYCTGLDIDKNFKCNRISVKGKVFDVLKYDKNTVCLLGQAISVEWKSLKIRRFEDISSGFTPRLHLLKVNYPMKI